MATTEGPKLADHVQVIGKTNGDLVLQVPDFLQERVLKLLTNAKVGTHA